MDAMRDQVTALAGIFQATFAVNQIAQTGQCDEQIIDTAISSLLNTNPDSTMDVFGSKENISSGLISLRNALDKSKQGQSQEVIRYALALMQLERKLSNTPEMLDLISSRLKQIESQIQLMGSDHPSIVENVANIYIDTLGTFKTRIHVTGSQTHLQIPQNAAKIRMLLLAGIRSAMLWRQQGGHRWHLIFKRAKIVDHCGTLLVFH